MRAGRALLVLGVAGTLLTGGGMLAYAGWSSTTDSSTFTVPGARLPTLARPNVLLPADGTVVLPRIAWAPVAPATDPDVHRYVVTRHAGRDAAVACTVAATQRAECLDSDAPPGITLTYTVAAARGTFWTGPDSEPSRAVTVPGAAVTPTASGTPTGSAAPSTAAPATAAPASSADPRPSPITGPATDSATGPATDPATGPAAGSSTDPPPAGDAASVPTPTPTDAPPAPADSAPPGTRAGAEPTPTPSLSPSGR